ncbi:MAG TPA: cytochrome P450 [Actinomycetota bacterium]|nr:cytochrome P450 [Actinomycetota bacterium]
MRRFAAGVLAFRDPVGLLERTGREGDLVELTRGKRPVFVVTSPDLAREVLETKADVFLKAAGSERLERVMGDGLQLSEDPHHAAQRGLMDRAFDHDHVVPYAEAVWWSAERILAGWRPGRVIEVVGEMRAITTGAVLRALFADANGAEVDRLTGDVTTVASGLWKALAPGAAGVKRALLPGFGRFGRALDSIDEYVAGAIRRRRSGEVGGHDLLGAMLAARPATGSGATAGPEGVPPGSGGMSDREARDEVISLLLAGRGTITAGLGWMWRELGRNPEVERRLHAEVDGVLEGGRSPAVADIGRLPFTRAAWDEALRVLPPSWVLRRKAARASELGGRAVPEGSTVLVNVIGIHRDAARYPEPGVFDPGRFLEGGRDPVPFDYLPFGAGPRGCIGFHFATMEAVLLIAGIAARWRLEPVDPDAELEFARSITLRSKRPIRMRLSAR